MKNALLAMLLFFSTVGLTNEMAHAEFIPGTPIWACTMKASLENDSVAFIIGAVDKHGPVRVRCYSLENLVAHKPFKKDLYMEIIGPAVGLDLNFVKAQTVYMASGEVGLHDYRQLIGRHSINLAVDVNLLVLEGGESVGIEFGNSVAALRRAGEISATEGIGATISLQEVNIYASKAQYEAAKKRRAMRSGQNLQGRDK